jgi:hypothetical protein
VSIAYHARMAPITAGGGGPADRLVRHRAHSLQTRVDAPAARRRCLDAGVRRRRHRRVGGRGAHTELDAIVAIPRSSARRAAMTGHAPPRDDARDLMQRGPPQPAGPTTVWGTQAPLRVSLRIG